jgi:tryprostatin B 6-hydroxylase
MFLFYCLAKHPQEAEKIQAELEGVDPLDITTITTLPHLNGVINESMRLYPVLPTSLYRDTPPEGVTIGDTYIPGNTKLMRPSWVMFRRKLVLTTSKANIRPLTIHSSRKLL